MMSPRDNGQDQTENGNRRAIERVQAAPNWSSSRRSSIWRYSRQIPQHKGVSAIHGKTENIMRRPLHSGDGRGDATLTAEFSKARESQLLSEHVIIELAVLTVLIVSLAISLMRVRKRNTPAAAERS
jgi:hypothetical protein